MSDLLEQLGEYGDFLDERARKASSVDRAGPSTPPLHRANTRRSSAARPVAIAAVVILVSVFAAVVVRGFAGSDRHPANGSTISKWRFAIPLDDVPEGVSSRRISGTWVFLVRRGDRVTTFLTDMHHFPGENVLYWCPSEKLFVSPTHGETFDRTGAVVGGPAFSGLDRLPTTVRENTVNVNYARVVADPRPRGSGYEAAFCDDGTRSGGGYRQPNQAPHATVDIGLTPSGAFEAASYTVPSGVVRLRVHGGGDETIFNVDDSRFVGVSLHSTDTADAATLTLPPGAYTIIASPVSDAPNEITTTLIATDAAFDTGVRNKTTLALPERGSASFAYLVDGTPVWVVRHDNGDVAVYDAASTHRPFGVNVLIGWCQANTSFEDPMYGSQWDAQGRKRGGPAPTGLAQYPATINGDQVVVSGNPAVVTTPAPELTDAPPGYIAPLPQPDCFDPAALGYDPGTTERPELTGAKTISVISLADQPARRKRTTYLVKDAQLVARSNHNPLLCSGTERSTCVSLPIDDVTHQPRLGADDRLQVALSGDLFITLGRHGPANAVFANGYKID